MMNVTLFQFYILHFYFWILKRFLLIQRDNICQQPVRAGYTRRQLTEENQTGVYKFTLAVIRNDKTALQFLFVFICHPEWCLECGCQLISEINSTFLYPSFKISCIDLIWII